MRRATVPTTDMPPRPSKAGLVRTDKQRVRTPVWLVEVAPLPSTSNSSPSLITNDEASNNRATLMKELILFDSEFLLSRRKSKTDGDFTVCRGLPDYMGTNVSSSIVRYDKSVTELSPHNQIKINRGSVSESDSFQHTIRPVIRIAQIFSLMPVQGFTGPNASSIRYRWFTFRVLYSLLVIFGLLTMVVFCGIRFVKLGGDFQNTPCVVFFGCATAVAILFHQLAKTWPLIATKWEETESALAHYGYPKHQHLRFSIITSGVLFMALVEHCLSYSRILRLSIRCGKKEEFDGFKTFSVNSYPHIFDFISYKLWNAVFALVLNVIATFSWNFMDLFIILISIALANRFRQINSLLRSIKGKPLPHTFWCQIREDYNLISSLTKIVDNAVSRIVLVSFGNNLYFICLQLLHSMHTPPQNTMQTIYFYLSLYFLLFRAVAVSLCAASINNESREPRSILYSVPSATYSEEVHRFLHQVTTDEVALTGYKFFSVTRTLLLTVAGTIVTYEIVLMQFNKMTDDERDSVETNVTNKFCY